MLLESPASGGKAAAIRALSAREQIFNAPAPGHAGQLILGSAHGFPRSDTGSFECSVAAQERAQT
jgi:hypothetical protein